MWILPKQLISAFAPDTEVLTLDSGECSQTCEQSLIRRSKHSPAKTYLREWKAGNLMRLRYGAISSRSLGQSFVTEWTSCLAVTPVNLSAQPGNDLEQKTQDIFGPTSQAEFKFFDQSSVSSRMLKGTSVLDSEKSLENWKALVTKRRGEYSRRKNASITTDAARRTSASGCSSWPTPNTADSLQGGTTQGNRKNPNLSIAVYGLPAPGNHSTHGSRPEPSANWPSPKVSDVADLRPNVDQSPTGAFRRWISPTKNMQANLSDAVQLTSRQESWATPIQGDSHLASTPDVAAARIAEGKTTLSRQVASQWATPATRDTQGPRGKGAQERKGNPMDTLPNQLETTSMKLNPRWVEALMGLPIGWTMPSCTSPATPA